MARKANYSDTHKFSNCQSFDGQPVSADKLLVPLFGLQKGDYIQDNVTTMRLGEFRSEIGFMSINESQFASYMKDFWSKRNEDMKMHREDRYIIGVNSDGSDTYTKRYTGCPDKGLL